jgi:hypothetical protein
MAGQHPDIATESLMNSFINARSTATTAHVTSLSTALRAAMEPVWRQPWFLCATVAVVALISTYVHVLNGQVERGERLRAGGMAQFTMNSKDATSQLLAQAGRQPVPTVGMGTDR